MKILWLAQSLRMPNKIRNIVKHKNYLKLLYLTLTRVRQKEEQPFSPIYKTVALVFFLWFSFKFLLQISSCKYGEGLPVFMESSQCLGYSRYRRVTIELCNPSKQNILREVKKALVQTNANYLFIATDNNPMIKDFEDSLHPLQVCEFWTQGEAV